MCQPFPVSILRMPGRSLPVVPRVVIHFRFRFSTENDRCLLGSEQSSSSGEVNDDDDGSAVQWSTEVDPRHSPGRHAARLAALARS